VTTPSTNPAAKGETEAAAKSETKPATVAAAKRATLNAAFIAAKPPTKRAAKAATVTAPKPPTVTAPKPATEIPALSQKSRAQLVSGLQQGQQLCIDAAQTWVNAFSTLPVIDLPKIPGVPDISDVQAATRFTLDIATDLLSAQREFALQLTNALLPAKTA
jgi:hypothetical protein